MRCWACQGELAETAPACPACGKDARFTVRAPDGRTFGPYVLADIRLYAAEGRIVPSAVLVAPDGTVHGLAQFGVVPMMPYGSPEPVPERSPVPGWAVFLIVVAVALPVLGVIAAAVLPVYMAARSPRVTGTTCLSNVKQLSLGLCMYCLDYDDRFPPDSAWGATVYPYVKNPSLFECSASGLGSQSYTLAPELYGLKKASVTAPAVTPMLYETGLIGGAVGPHNGDGHCGFVDAHARGLTPLEFVQLSTNLPQRPPP